MTSAINIGIIGFSAREEHKLKKIFRLSQQHLRAYNLVENTDIDAAQVLMVKKSDDLEKIQAQHKKKKIPIVLVGRDLPANADNYYIHGLLVPSRVFSVLDTINLNPEIDHLESQAETTEISTYSPSFDEVADDATILQVLVVDDSPMMQKTVQLELQQATIPLAVDFADSGEQALEKVALKKYAFIFLDVMMTGIDGFETCKQMRLREGMAKTPIIMLTSKTSPADEVKGLMAGCTTYITKPIDHDEFHQMLERIAHWIKEFNDKNNR